MPKSEGDYAICHSNQYTLKMKGDIINNQTYTINIAQTALSKPELSITLPKSYTKKQLSMVSKYEDNMA